MSSRLAPASGDAALLRVAAARLRSVAAALDRAGVQVTAVLDGVAVGAGWTGAAAGAARLGARRRRDAAARSADALGDAAAGLDDLAVAVEDARAATWRADLLPADEATRALDAGIERLAAADAAVAARLRRVVDALHAVAARGGPAAVADLAGAAAQRALASAGLLSRAGLAPAAVLAGLAGCASPLEVRGFAATLSVPQRAWLVARHPDRVGARDGMPVSMRYAANRLLMLRTGAAAAAGGDRRTAMLLAQLLADGRRQFLVFDPHRPDRVAEVVGRLESATHVAVLVPGVGGGLSSFAGLAADARRLRGAAAGSGETAVVAWVGYNAPPLSGALLERRALRGADRLRDLVQGLLLGPAVGTTVIGHSYGSVVAAGAVRAGLRVDAVAFLGSPGTGVDRRERLGSASTRVYAARAPMDPVAWSEAYGRDPSDPRYGATRLVTGAGVRGHSAYFRPGSESLANLARVATGSYAAVSTVQAGPVERAAGRLDEVTGALRWPLDRVQDGTDAAMRGLTRLEDAAQRVDLGPLDDPVDATVDRIQRTRADLVEVQSRLVDVVQRTASPDLGRDLSRDLSREVVDDVVRGAAGRGHAP